jgi:hypothetical protein
MATLPAITSRLKELQMKAKVKLPKAFSVRNEHEFFPIEHLLARMNPELKVEQVAKGVHVNGGDAVLWGLVFLEDDPPGKKKLEAALKEAGFDFDRNGAAEAAEEEQTESMSKEGKE